MAPGVVRALGSRAGRPVSVVTGDPSGDKSIVVSLDGRREAGRAGGRGWCLNPW
jgi:hypothetical protein